MSARRAGRLRSAVPRPPARLRRRLFSVGVAVALCLAAFLTFGFAVPQPAGAASPTQSAMIPGRHVYDFGNQLSASARATAESLATKLEAAGSGRVIVYTDDLLKLPSAEDLVSAWNIDGLLLSGWDDMGSAEIGPTLTARLSTNDAKFIGDSSSGPASMESWVTSTLARADSLLSGSHIFDGAGALDATGRAQAEAAAAALATRIGFPVYVDIALGDPGEPASTAFFNAAGLSSDLGKSLVIGLAVSDKQIGGYIDSDGDLWDLYETNSPWSYDSLSNEAAPNGDVQAELLRAIDAVHKPPDPAEAAASVSHAASVAVTGFFADGTNQAYSAGGAIAAVVVLVAFALVRWRRRRDAGYGDDDSVLLPAPPAEMTPALAALVAAPLNTTRAVTTALLDLAAHGLIAFYQQATPLGPAGGIRVLSAAAGAWGEAGASGASATIPGVHSVAIERPIGPAEQRLLDGLQMAAGKDGGIAHTDFASLRPLFEQTGEELERIAGQRGWLRLEAKSISIVWVGLGLAYLVGAGFCAVLRQPVAVLFLAFAGLRIVPRALRMPLPLRTRDGQMTSAMVDAYRRTLKRALKGGPGEVPPWLANAEEAALWGYAWGLEGEVQAFVAASVGTALHGTAMASYDSDTLHSTSLRGFGLMMGGLAGTGPMHPVGLDTDAIAGTLSGLGRSMSAASGSHAAPGGSSGGDTA